MGGTVATPPAPEIGAAPAPEGLVAPTAGTPAPESSAAPTASAPAPESVTPIPAAAVPAPERIATSAAPAPAPERFVTPAAPAPAPERFAPSPVAAPPAAERGDLPPIVAPNATSPTAPIEIPEYTPPPSDNPIVASGQDIVGGYASAGQAAPANLASANLLHDVQLPGSLVATSSCRQS